MRGRRELLGRLSVVAPGVVLMALVALCAPAWAQGADGDTPAVAPVVVPVSGQLAAYNARDVDAFVKFFAEDVVVARHPSGEEILRGRAALRVTYAKMFELSPKLHATITQRIVHGDWVIDHESVVGIRGGGPVRAVAVYQVRDGLIQRVWFLPVVRPTSPPAPSD